MKIANIFKFFLLAMVGLASCFAAKAEGHVLLAERGTEEKPVEKVSKKIFHDLKADKNIDVRITNKYGKINISSWEKDSVKLSIEISAVAKTKEEAEKILQRVHVEPVFDEKYFILTTEISEKTSGNIISQLIDDLTDKAKELIDKTNVEIIISITVPERAKITVNNKYGDINFSQNFKGSLQATLAYGNLNAHELPPFSSLSVQSGNIYASMIQNGRIALKYGKLALRSADRLYLESSSSEIDIDEVKDLDMDSRNDDFNILSAYSLTGKTSLSKIFVQEMKQKARLEMQGGSLKIRTLKASFDWIDIQSKSTDIKITPEENLAYQLDISGTPNEVLKNENTANTQKKSAVSSLISGLTDNGKSNPFSTNLTNNGGNNGKKVIKINANGGQIAVK